MTFVLTLIFLMLPTAGDALQVPQGTAPSAETIEARKTWEERLRQAESQLTAKRDERKKLKDRMGNMPAPDLEEKIDKLDQKLTVLSTQYRQLIAEADSGNYLIAGGDTPKPKTLFVVYPTYPDEALREKIEGRVKLKVEFDHSGTITDVQVTEGLGFGLDEKAIEAAKKIVFFPRVEGGHFVSYISKVEFTFSFVGSGSKP